MANNLSSNTLDILNQCTVKDNSIHLPDVQLERSDYDAVNEVFSNLGGKWNKKEKAHLFPYPIAGLLAGVIASGELPPKNPTAFFPTPSGVVDSMIELSGVNEFMDADWRVLEPSAGTGAIARAVRQAADSVTLHCCEVLPVNRAALQSEGFEVVADDFMSYTPDQPYDVILMNPPFSLDGDPVAYITHIRHAWSMLKEHGYLVAITPCGWLTNSTKKQVEFREFVCDQLEFYEIGSGVFKESGTMTNTMLVYGSKDAVPWRTKPYNGWNSYHTWNAALWIDNERELYERARKANKTREHFDSICRDTERALITKHHTPVVLRPDDVEALWRYYTED